MQRFSSRLVAVVTTATALALVGPALPAVACEGGRGVSVGGVMVCVITSGDYDACPGDTKGVIVETARGDVMVCAPIRD